MPIQIYVHNYGCETVSMCNIVKDDITCINLSTICIRTSVFCNDTILGVLWGQPRTIKLSKSNTSPITEIKISQHHIIWNSSMSAAFPWRQITNPVTNCYCCCPTSATGSLILQRLPVLTQDNIQHEQQTRRVTLAYIIWHHKTLNDKNFQNLKVWATGFIWNHINFGWHKPSEVACCLHGMTKIIRQHSNFKLARLATFSLLSAYASTLP